MSTITNTQGLNTDLYWQEEKVKVSDGSEQNLSQEDFFALLTEQLSNQDPTKPVDNDQMVSQMTQFTTADGIAKLQTTNRCSLDVVAAEVQVIINNFKLHAH